MRNAPLQVDLPYLVEDEDRYGTPRVYVRRYGRKIRIREVPGSLAFLAAYNRALAELSGRKPVDRPGGEFEPFPPGTFGWLAAKYFGSAEFQGIDAQSQRTRRNVIEHCLRQAYKLASGRAEPMGRCPLEVLDAAKIKQLRDAKAGKPGAANNRRKYLSAMFAWGLEQTPPLVAMNPTRDVKRVSYSTDGFHTWSVEEVEQFRAHHAIGSKPRLALELMLLLGVRRSDAVVLGRQHRRGNTISFVPQKTRYKRKRVSEKPILPGLAHVLERSPCGDLTFIVTEWGKPFGRAGFGNWFREQCDAAGLPNCSAHGLRKAGATIAAENGATIHELMAIFDWENPAQAKVYTDAADRKHLAARAMGKIVPLAREGETPTEQNAS